MRMFPPSLIDLSLKNLRRRPFRSIGLIALVALLSFSLIAGGMLSYGLFSGLDSVSSRLGADVLVVPKGYEQKTEGVLLQGEPSTFYIDGDRAEQVLKSGDFAQASPQLFIATLDSDHCAFPVQLIGYDPDTDFVIGPWLSSARPQKLGFRDIVIGANIQADIGDQLLFFDSYYQVVAKLEQTGMGFDTSVFFNMETARAALKEYVYYTDAQIPDQTHAVSVVTADIPGGYTTEFQRYINDKYRGSGLEFIFTKNMISSLTQHINALLTFCFALLIILWGVSVGVLMIVFAVTLNERKREFAIYRALGSSRKWLTHLILTETFLTSIAGAGTGVLVFGVLAFSFRPLIERELSLPYITPGHLNSLLIILSGFVIAVAVGLLTSAVSSARIGSLTDKALRPGGD